MATRNFTLAFFLAICSSSLLAKPKPDTTDNWAVLYNARVLARFDETSKRSTRVIVLKVHTILAKDIIRLLFSCDTPCGDCKTELVIDSPQNIELARGRGSQNALTVYPATLFELWKNRGRKPLDVYYQDGRRKHMVFRLNFSN